MAKDLNKVQIIGRLGGDPDMRYTAAGSAVANFSVAAGRQWKDRDGNQNEETEWFRVVAWDKLGEICNQYLTKGARVYIEGRLATRKWQDKDGNDRYTTEVVAQDMIMLDTRGQRGEEPAEDETSVTPHRPAARAPRRNQPQPIGDDDEIPF